MAANLNININGPSGGGIGGGGGLSVASLRGVEQLLSKQIEQQASITKAIQQQADEIKRAAEEERKRATAAAAASQARAESAKAEKAAAQAARDAQKAADAAAKESARATASARKEAEKAAVDAARAQVQAAKDAERSAREAANAQKRAQREVERAHKEAADAIVASQKRAEQAAKDAAKRVSDAWKRASAQIRSATAGAFSGITSGSAFKTSGGAGFSPGGILAAFGDVSAIGVRVGGDIVGGITKGIAGGVAAVGGAVASLAAAIPGAAGGIISGGVSIATGLVSGIVSGLGGAVSGIADALGDVLGEAAKIAGKTFNIALTAAVGVAIGSAFKAAQFENISGAFAGLAKGIGGSSDSLERFRKASKGTVSDLDLLTQANNAILLGAVQTEGQFDRLIEAGRRLGKATGRTAAEGIADLSTGIGRQSKLILDNLGLIVQSEASYEAYAKSIGKAASELSDTEKKLAFQTAAFAAIDEKLKELGPETESFSDSFSRLKATIENTAVSIGQSLLPVFEAIIEPLERIGRQIAASFSANQEEIIAGITSALEGFLNALANIADIIENEGFGGIFERLKTSAISLWKSFVTVGEGAVDAIGQLLSALWTRTKAELIGAITSGFETALNAIIDATPVGLVNKLFGGSKAVDLSGLGGESANQQRGIAGAQAQGALLTFQLAVEEASKALKPAADIFKQITAPRASGGATGPTATVPLIQNPAEQVQTSRNSISVDITRDVAALEGQLKTVITDFSNLSDAAQEEIRSKLEEIGKSGEKTTRFIRNLEQAREDQRLEELEASTRANEKIVREQERSVEKIADQLAKASDAFSKQFEALNEAIDAEVAKIEDTKAKALADIDNRVASAADSIRGGANRSNAPLNVRKAIDKVQRDQDQAQKNLLRELSQGLSSQDLAANGGALLDKLLNQAATIQTGAEGLRIDAILQANADIAASVELSLDAQQALIEASEETANSLTELLAEEKAALGEIKAILERQSSELNAAKAERKELRRALSLLS